MATPCNEQMDTENGHKQTIVSSVYEHFVINNVA